MNAYGTPIYQKTVATHDREGQTHCQTMFLTQSNSGKGYYVHTRFYTIKRFKSYEKAVAFFNSTNDLR